MRRLQQLIHHKIVRVGDELYFTFKKHVFSGVLASGGLIWRCKWKKPGHTSQQIFKQHNISPEMPFVRTFESLTDWTETCIQECLHEYHTRYSSWKRVRHKKTEKTMEVLFKQLQKNKIQQQRGERNSDLLLLYEELVAHKAVVNEQRQEIKAWKQWFKQLHPESPFPIANNNPNLHYTPQKSNQTSITWNYQTNDFKIGLQEFTNKSNAKQSTHQWNPIQPQMFTHGLPTKEASYTFLHQFFTTVKQ